MKDEKDNDKIIKDLCECVKNEDAKGVSDILKENPKIFSNGPKLKGIENPFALAINVFNTISESKEKNDNTHRRQDIILDIIELLLLNEAEKIICVVPLQIESAIGNFAGYINNTIGLNYPQFKKINEYISAKFKDYNFNVKIQKYISLMLFKNNIILRDGLASNSLINEQLETYYESMLDHITKITFSQCYDEKIKYFVNKIIQSNSLNKIAQNIILLKNWCMSNRLAVSQQFKAEAYNICAYSIRKFINIDNASCNNFRDMLSTIINSIPDEDQKKYLNQQSMISIQQITLVNNLSKPGALFEYQNSLFTQLQPSLARKIQSFSILTSKEQSLYNALLDCEEKIKILNINEIISIINSERIKQCFMGQLKEINIDELDLCIEYRKMRASFLKELIEHGEVQDITIDRLRIENKIICNLLGEEKYQEDVNINQLEALEQQILSNRAELKDISNFEIEKLSIIQKIHMNFLNKLNQILIPLAPPQENFNITSFQRQDNILPTYTSFQSQGNIPPTYTSFQRQDNIPPTYTSFQRQDNIPPTYTSFQRQDNIPPARTHIEQNTIMQQNSFQDRRISLNQQRNRSDSIYGAPFNGGN